MKIKKIISGISTALLLTTMVSLNGLAAEKDAPAPKLNGDRWAFRQAYVDMVRVENKDGTYSFPKMGLTDKIDVFSFLHNLVDLTTISDGTGVPGYPGQLTFYRQPMFINLPKDIADTVGPEDIEIYTTFSNPGTGFKGKLSDEQLTRLYTRKDSWTNGRGNDVDSYKNGDPKNNISIPELSRYSAKEFNVATPVLYDKDHQEVKAGQKGGAYFKIDISGAVETINPGDPEKPDVIKGYGLRVDDRKRRELTTAIRKYIEAGLFSKSGSGYTTGPPSDPFTMDYFNEMLSTGMDKIVSGNGLFEDFVQNITSTDNMIYGKAFDLATQFMNIDATVASNRNPALAEMYGELGNIQSTWAMSKEGLIPYFEEVLLTQNEYAMDMYTNTVRGQFLDMMLRQTGEPSNGYGKFHNLLTGLSGGSYIKHKRDANGKSIIERDPITGGPIYVDNFAEAFQNVSKTGGVETSIFFAFEPALHELYGRLEGLSNSQIENELNLFFDSLLDPGGGLSQKALDIMDNIFYVSKLEASPPPQTFRTFFPIAIRLKIKETVNLAATKINVKNDGCVEWEAEMKEGEAEVETEGIVRAYDRNTGKLVKSAVIKNIKFDPDNKRRSGEVCLGSEIEYVYEFEINPEPRNPEETTYEDNKIKQPPVDLIASALTVTSPQGSNNISVNWTGSLDGKYTGATTVEIVVKNAVTGTVLGQRTIPNQKFDKNAAINGQLQIGVPAGTPLQKVRVHFRVNLPGGNPGKEPGNELTYSNNELTMDALIGEVPPPADIPVKCETMSWKDGSGPLIRRVERRSWGEAKTGQVLGWTSTRSVVDDCPSQEEKTTRYMDDNRSWDKQEHFRYSCGYECIKWDYDDDGNRYCVESVLALYTKQTATVMFRAEVLSHKPFVWNNRFLDRNWIRSGYGVNLGGEMRTETDYDRMLQPVVAIYRPKDEKHNIDVKIRPDHIESTYTVDTNRNGGVRIISNTVSGSIYTLKYQSADKPLIDSTGSGHGVTNQRFINVQRRDGPYRVWFMPTYWIGGSTPFIGTGVDGHEYVLGACDSRTIEVKGTMYDDYWVHPSDPGAPPNRPQP